MIGFTWQPLCQKSCPEQVQYAPALFLGRAESSKSVSGLKQMHTSEGSWQERHTPNNPFSGHKWKKTVSKICTGKYICKQHMGILNNYQPAMFKTFSISKG